jgi:hypothetical protein
LRKSYHEPAIGGLGALSNLMINPQGRTITNKWVAETPSEFRRILKEVFNLGTVKSDVLNLVCGTSEAETENPADCESQDEKD